MSRKKTSYLGNASQNNEAKSRSDRFHNSPIDRRQFIQLSIATAGALALPGNATADHESEKTSELYDFVRNHVASDYYIQTLILLNSEDGFEAIDNLDLGPAEDDDEDEGDIGTYPVEVRETTDPRPAAYAHVTPGDVESVLDLDEVEQVEFAPGANPFWQLDNYDDGVFPAVEDSVDYIDFDEAVNGVQVLGENYSDRLNVFTIGESVGHYNLLEGGREPQDMWVVELSNDIDDNEVFEKKRKAIFSVTIHSDETAGRESALRLVEHTLEGEDSGMDEWLDDIVLVLIFTNPDGWIVRNPQYSGVEQNFERGNAGGVDLNRAFPTEGWIDPEHYPSEPWGANLEDDQPGEIDDDVPDDILAHVPDGLALANHVRTYDNIELMIDLHGMGWSEEPVESRPLFYTLTQNSNQFDHELLHDADEMTRFIGEAIREEVGSLDDHQEALLDGAARFAAADDDNEPEDMVPEIIFRDSSSFDTLGYTTTGGLRSFVGGSTDFSGLGVKGNTVELLFGNIPGGYSKEYRPEFHDLSVDAYTACLRGYVEYATTDIEATIETDNRSIAYVESDTLTRTSDDLVFADVEETATSTSASLDGSDDTETISLDMAEDVGYLSIHIEHSHSVVATLIDPAGETIETYESAGEMEREAEWSIPDPEAGEWAIELENQDDDENDVAVQVDQLLMEENDENVDGVLTPNPEDVLGFTQSEYETNPVQYFEDNREYFVDADMTILSVSDVADGALFDNDNGDLAYDNIVINHDEPAGDSECLDELDAFVDADGNLVLTDTGVHLLADLENDLAAGLSEDDIDQIERQTPFLENDPDDDELPTDGKNLDHPLMDGARVIQRELWNIAGLGYATDNNEAPMTLIDVGAFEGAGGSIASTTDDQVSVGALGDADGNGIKVIGSLLPPVLQSNLHPFGMVNYTIEIFGHNILMNALGYEQQRLVDGELVEVWNNAEERDAEP